MDTEMKVFIGTLILLLIAIVWALAQPADEGGEGE